MFVVSLGKTLKENKGLSLMKVPQWCDFKRLMDATTQMLGCDQTSLTDDLAWGPDRPFPFFYSHFSLMITLAHNL